MALIRPQAGQPGKSLDGGHRPAAVPRGEGRGCGEFGRHHSVGIQLHATPPLSGARQRGVDHFHGDGPAGATAGVHHKAQADHGWIGCRRRRLGAVVGGSHQHQASRQVCWRWVCRRQASIQPAAALELLRKVALGAGHGGAQPALHREQGRPAREQGKHGPRSPGRRASNAAAPAGGRPAALAAPAPAPGRPPVPADAASSAAVSATARWVAARWVARRGTRFCA